MEDVLDLYAEPPDLQRPRVCFDEMPKQLIAETRQPLPASPGQPERFDYEYRRNGTCNLFMFVDPDAGWRHVAVTAQRTKVGFAHQMDIAQPRASIVERAFFMCTITESATFGQSPRRRSRRWCGMRARRAMRGG